MLDRELVKRMEMLKTLDILHKAKEFYRSLPIFMFSMTMKIELRIFAFILTTNNYKKNLSEKFANFLISIYI